MILQFIATIFVGVIVWKFFLQAFYQYFKVGNVLGFDKVALLYKPFTGYDGILQWSAKKYDNSYGFFFEAIKKNPMLKIMIVKLSIGVQLYILDPQMIRKMANQYYKQLPKANMLIFKDEVSKGLVFTQGLQWKNSRAILSQLFHFEMLRGRQKMIKNVIEDKAKDLDKNIPNLFKFGCSIGGEVVVKSLFGELFFEIKFNGKNPYEQIQQILAVLVEQTRKVPHILHLILLGDVTSKSNHLLQSQKSILNRLLNFKQVSRKYIENSKIKYEKKEPLPPFLEAYFKLQDDSYYEEMIHQLFLFLLAGEDTTGTFIEKSLATLATYPQYQQKILEDLKHNDVYSSKQLTNFINEVNRMKGPISVVVNRYVEQPFTIDGFTFTKGTKITMANGAPMMNPRFWQNPQEFNPERFNKPIENPMAFIPFFAGPRNCIGQHMAIMQVKLTIKSVLQKYKLHKVGKNLNTKASTIINNLVDPYFVRFQRK